MHTEQLQQIGFIGLGRMGQNMAARLVEQGYRVVGVDPDSAAANAAQAGGVEVAADYQALAAALTGPRTIWVMVPSQFVDEVLATLIPALAPGDTVIDGGNSFYKDSVRRHQTLSDAGLQFLDCGTSGGVSGARHGASLMVGGDEAVYRAHESLFAALATENGYARVGSAGAGHFVKMVHNGIEYGMMGALTEGLAALEQHQEEFGISLPEVFKPYEHGSVIESQLLSWLRQAYENGLVGEVAGMVPVGETEEEMEHLTTIASLPILQAALLQRKETRHSPSHTGKLLAALRNQFGGHAVIKQE